MTDAGLFWHSYTVKKKKKMFDIRIIRKSQSTHHLWRVIWYWAVLAWDAGLFGHSYTGKKKTKITRHASTKKINQCIYTRTIQMNTSYLSHSWYDVLIFFFFHLYTNVKRALRLMPKQPNVISRSKYDVFICFFRMRMSNELYSYGYVMTSRQKEKRKKNHVKTVVTCHLIWHDSLV